MALTIAHIKAFLESEGLKYEYSGRDDLEIADFSPLSGLKPDSITWIRNIMKYDLSNIDSGLNLLIVTNGLPENCDISKYNILVSNDPRMLYFEILERFFGRVAKPAGIAHTAVVETDKIGSNVRIGHNCYICADVIIGNNTIINNNVVIECPTVIGDDCVIGSGTVIGTHGYAYYRLPNGRIKKVRDFAGVTIGNRVELGANVCVSRGTLSDTILEDDVKIDNFTHIAHNVRFCARGRACAGVTLCGSITVEEDSYIAPRATVINGVRLGKSSFVGLGSTVGKDVEANTVVMGVTARVLRNDNVTEW